MTDFESEILKSLTERGMLETRFNKETNEQELCITDFGIEMYKVLEFFVKVENCECGHPMSIHRTQWENDRARVYSFSCRNVSCECQVVRKE